MICKLQKTDYSFNETLSVVSKSSDQQESPEWRWESVNQWITSWSKWVNTSEKKISLIAKAQSHVGQYIINNI